MKLKTPCHRLFNREGGIFAVFCATRSTSLMAIASRTPSQFCLRNAYRLVFGP